MDEAFRIGLLYQVYGSFLTKNQQSLMHSYFYEDLSLQEIGNNMGISKQAVSSQLHRAVNKISNMETQLKVLEKTIIADQAMGEVMNRIHQTLLTMEDGPVKEELMREMDELRLIRDKLMSEESGEEDV